MIGPVTASSRRTPYNDDYETCETTYVKLLIYPEDTDPDLITNRLGIAPTHVSKKGRDEQTPSGKVRPAPLSLWLLSSEDKVDSKDLRRHLDWLLSCLVPVKAQFLALQELKNTRMSISCVWWSAHGHGGPTLWPEQMQLMAELRLECTFDIYFADD